MTEPEPDPDLDPHSGNGTSRSRIATAVARGIAILVGLATVASGVGLYALRCFSTCPSDPALDRILQMVTISLSIFGVILVVGAGTLGTRWSLQGTWVITALGAAMAIAGGIALTLFPSLRPTSVGGSLLTFGIFAVAGGAGSILLARRLRA